MSRRSIDETVIVNGVLPKSWKCPHCGKRQTFAKEEIAEEEEKDDLWFMGY